MKFEGLMNVRARHVVIVAMASCYLWSRASFAQPSDSDVGTARQLTIDGLAALDAHDYARAEERFSRADKLIRAPTVVLGLARARRGLGKLVGAQEAYSRVVHMVLPSDASQPFIQAVADARNELAQLAPRVPSVIVEVSGGSVPSVSVDGVEIPSAALGVSRPVDPGTHVLRASSTGFATAEATILAVEGKTERVTLTLKPAPNSQIVRPLSDNLADHGAETARPSPLVPVGVAALGVGAAGLIAGAVTGAIGLSKQSDLLKHCPDGACPSDMMTTYQGEVHTYNLMRTASIAGFAAGGAMAATGIVLVAIGTRAPKTDAQVITPMVGPFFWGAAGKF